MSENSYNDIFNFLTNLTCIDSHEHIPANESLREQDTDILREYCRYYTPTDLKSAGYRNYDYLMDIKEPILKRWADAAPYWEHCRYTNHLRIANTAARVLYGVSELNSDTIETANNGFQALLKSKQSYKKVINEVTKAKICIKECTIDDLEAGIDFRYFKIALRLDNLINPRFGKDKLQLERYSGIRIACFEDWIEACEAVLNKVYSTGEMVAVKTEMAYERDLHFSRVTFSEAEKAFNECIMTPNHYITPEEDTYNTTKTFQDYMVHFILRWCNKCGMVVQIHTGVQEGNRHKITDSNPEELISLFWDYENVRFDLLHVGFPYFYSVLTMVKQFPNVFTNLTFIPNMSVQIYAHILSTSLDLFSFKKITAYGGDVSSLDLAVGSYYAMLQGVARGLSNMIDKENRFDIQEAQHIAKHLLYENPVAIYKLNNKT